MRSIEVTGMDPAAVATVNSPEPTSPPFLGAASAMVQCPGLLTQRQQS